MVASLVVEHGLWGTLVSVVVGQELCSYSSQALKKHSLNSCVARA